MIEVANLVGTDNISNRMSQSIKALQYADDTAVVANGSKQSITLLKITLNLFAKVSGLQINYAKSCFVPFNMTPEQIRQTTNILGCRRTVLPVKYLGMPLPISAPGRDQYLPLIEKMDRKLQGWNRSLISRGGLQLVKSSVPIYHMTCFVLPKWVIMRLDQIRRRFLWGKNGSQGTGISLISWQEVCSPIGWGGMGITDLWMHNRALVLRWWWRLYAKKNGTMDRGDYRP